MFTIMILIMAQYGIKFVNFYVNDINMPEDDPAVNTLKEALAKRAEMDIVGYNYAQERSFDTLEGAATNPSSSQAGLMGTGIGLGLGFGVGGAVGSQFGEIAQNLNTTTKTKPCPNCNATIGVEKRFVETVVIISKTMEKTRMKSFVVNAIQNSMKMLNFVRSVG